VRVVGRLVVERGVGAAATVAVDRQTQIRRLLQTVVGLGGACVGRVRQALDVTDLRAVELTGAIELGLASVLAGAENVTAGAEGRRAGTEDVVLVGSGEGFVNRAVVGLLEPLGGRVCLRAA